MLSMCELQSFALGHTDRDPRKWGALPTHLGLSKLNFTGEHCLFWVRETMKTLDKTHSPFVRCGVGHHPSPMVSVGPVGQLLAQFPSPTL